MRILVVDDEEDLAEAIGRGLRREGYAIDLSFDGEDALAKAAVNAYDLICLDLTMPGIDGLEVCRRLREGPNPAEPPRVLMLTARDTIDDRIAGLDAGADDYLVKPFELSELGARVKALIRRAAGQPQPIIKIGNVEVNTTTRTVTLDGAVAPLTAKEYALLEFLTLHRGELVTRMAIYDHLFDETDDTLSNLLDVYVSNLRRKLRHDLIETRRGQGYMIHEEVLAADG